MTHTLHRVINAGDVDDFVIMAMPARGYNNDERVKGKLQNFLKIFASHNPVNMGAVGIGTLYEMPAEQIIENVYPELPMVHGVFSKRDDLIAALKDIKQADMGISVIVTGLVDSVDCCIKKAGLSRHSMNYSLGIWGDKSLLPDEPYLKIISMCGHAMISVNIVKKMAEDIKKGAITVEAAAAELAKPCVCGIFNGEKAKQILLELT